MRCCIQGQLKFAFDAEAKCRHPLVIIDDHFEIKILVVYNIADFGF